MKPGGDGDIKDDIVGFFNEIPDLMALYNDAMKAAQEEAKALGFDIFSPTGSASGGGLGSGIQQITESTANLLGSYLNAIRADVSVNRQLLQTHLPRISDVLLNTCPSLLEYQAQIAANTFETAKRSADIAASNQEILSELRGLITYDGGNGAAVKTYM